jgi:hypothetical protein
METKEVSFTTKSNLTFRVIVGEETAIIRMRRANMQIRVYKEMTDNKDDEDVAILRSVFYPDCIAATVDWCGMSKPSFEEFQLLPGEFVDNWAKVVWELNPDWEPEPPEITPEWLAEQEKKQSILTSVLSELSNPEKTKMSKKRH